MGHPLRLLRRLANGFQIRGIDPGHDPQPPELLAQFRLLDLALVHVRGILASDEQLAGTTEQLPLPLADLESGGWRGRRRSPGWPAVTVRFMASLATKSGLWVRGLLIDELCPEQPVHLRPRHEARSDIWCLDLSCCAQ